MARLRRLFNVSKPVKPETLLGTWVAVNEVWTEKFLTGRRGPDHVEADENGIRRPDVPLKDTTGRPQTVVPGHPLEWVLTFRDVGGRLQAVSQTAWSPTGDISNVRFESNGDFTFEKDYAGDMMWVYRCRESDLRRLVCLFKNACGHGIEFRKPADPTPP